MSAIFSRRRRSQSFGSYGSFKDQLAMEQPIVAKPELIEGYAHICFDEQGLWFRGILLTADGQSSYNLSGKRTRLGLAEEEDTKEQSPDVIRDFPSPLRSSNFGSTEISRTPDTSMASESISRQNSLDSRTEKELQFILEGIPLETKKSESPPSRPGSPPSTQQIIKALDNLLIRNGTERILEENDTSPVFRSRSGSRSMQHIETVSVVFDICVIDLEEGTEHTLRNVGGRKGNTFTLRNRQVCFATERAYWGQRADMVIQKQLAAPELVGQRCHVFAGPMRFYFDSVIQPVISSSSSLTNWCW